MKNSDDEDDVAWTQIEGPSENEMSDSGDDDVAVPIHLRIPPAVLNADRNAVPAGSATSTRLEVHRRYRDFAVWLCTETATEAAGQHRTRELCRCGIYTPQGYVPKPKT